MYVYYRSLLERNLINTNKLTGNSDILFNQDLNYLGRNLDKIPVFIRCVGMKCVYDNHCAMWQCGKRQFSQFSAIAYGHQHISCL